MEANPHMPFRTPGAAPSAPPLSGPGGHGGPGGQAPQGVQLRRLQAVLDRFEISIAEANDLVVLQDYRIVILCDDSGSMQHAAEPPSQRRLGSPSKTRWQELQETVSAIIEIASCVNDRGLAVHFLNRPPLQAVASASDPRFLKAFAMPPNGGTPLVRSLRNVVQTVDKEHGMLLFIFTDGEPSDGKKEFRDALRKVVKEHNVRVQIMACTSDDSVMDWLNSVDSEFTEVDVTDDYYSERAEVLRVGLAPRFTRGDWCMKALLGPVSRKYDLWDERMQGQGMMCNFGDACCIS